MKKILNEVFKFGIQLIVFLSVSFILHQYYYTTKSLEWDSYLVVESYLSNFVLVLITYGAIIFFKERKNESLGFIFLYGFFLKIGFFVFTFHPVYKADGEIETVEFFAFFIPYLVCLAFETTVIVRILNRS